MSASTGWITFDCFGTLMDWRSWFVGTIASPGDDRGPRLWEAYLAHEGLVERERPFRSYKDVVVAAVQRAADEQGVFLAHWDAASLPDAWASMQPFGDVEAMLAQLRLNGWRLAVLTNCDDDLFEITHRAFRMPFDLVVTSERVRGYKPGRWHFRAFELMTGVSRSQWVHVANSWYHDIAPARELGLSHVWLDRDGAGHASSPGSIRVSSGAEVARAIDALVERSSTSRPMLCAGGQ